jgi:hypothetical protein
VLFGGAPKMAGESYYNDTWIFSSATGAWSQGPAAPAGLTPRDGAAMAFDPDIGKIVMFGGEGTTWPPFDETWLFDGSSWSQGPAAPPALQGRVGAGMVYDPDIERLVLYGGSGVTVDRDTWLFDGTQWSPGPDAPREMAPRAWFGMAYDPVQHGVMVAGGDGGTDTWYFDGSSWIPGPSLGPVGPVEQFTMDYDPTLGGMVIFSGLGPGAPVSDMWFLRGGSWLSVPGNGGPWPDGRARPVTVWNPTMDALMMVTGIDNADAGTNGYADAWFFRDVAPKVASVQLSPNAPTQDNSIKLATGTLSGGYKSWTYTYRWYVNGLPVAGATGGKLSPSIGHFVHGDQVRAEVRITDALGVAGPVVSSPTITVVDRAPSIQSASIAPGIVYSSNTLTAMATTVKDPDGDQVTLHYAWRVDGQTMPDNDQPTLAPSRFTGGDGVTVTITPVDSPGMSGLAVPSAAKTVLWSVIAGSGQPGATLPGGVHGGGFRPSEVIDLRIDSPSSTTLASVGADSSGAFPKIPLVLPTPLPGGVHTLYGVGRTSGTIGSGPVTIVPVGAISPSAVAAGDVTTLAGSGFVPGEPVSVSFPGGIPTTVVANSVGSLSIPIASPPEPAAGGSVAAAASSGVASARFTVLTRFTSPITAEPGDLAAVAMTGFASNESITARFDGGPVTKTFQADKWGSVAATLPLRTTFGGHDISVTGLASGIVKTNHISLPAYVSISPASGVIRTVVAVSSSFGWVPGESVGLYFGGALIKTVTADSTGSVSTTFVVPQHQVGAVPVKLKDTVLGVAPSATYTMIA